MAQDLDFINAKTLKGISSKTIIVDAIFGIGGRIDLGNELEEILSDCNRFESKITPRQDINNYNNNRSGRDIVNSTKVIMKKGGN